MINDMAQLEGALHQIAWAADALEGMRRDVTDQNTALFPVIAEAYIHQIRSLTDEAHEYVRFNLAGSEQRLNGNGSGDNGLAEQVKPLPEKIAA